MNTHLPWDPLPTFAAGNELRILQQRLLQTAEGLFRDARKLDEDLRQRQAKLAERFQHQAQQLEVILKRFGQGDSPRIATRTAVDTSSTTLFPTHRPHLRQPSQPRTLDDLCGSEALHTLLRRRFIYPLRNPQRALRYRQHGGGGVLLFGPPGTGKTLMARTLATELGIPVFTISPSQVVSKWLGDSERKLAELFGQARQHPASLIFIDEIDALAPNREDRDGNDAMRRLLAQLLTELDGYTVSSGRLLFLAATNRPWDIDSALLRPGRFDALAYVGLPSHATRTELLRRHLDGVPQVSQLDLTSIAHQLHLYSPAETVAVAISAAGLAFADAEESGQDRPVSEADLAKAAQQVHRMATPEMLSRFHQFAETHGLPYPANEDKPAAETINAITPDPSAVQFAQISARELTAEIETHPFISYALQHAGINPVRKLVVKNHGKEASQNLLLELALIPNNFGDTWTANIPELAPGAHWECANISLPLRIDRLQEVKEKELAHVRLTIRDKDEILFASTRELPVLAYNEWIFLPEFLELSAAFVQSNSAALHDVMAAATEQLEKATGQRAFSGYQSGDRNYVMQMLQAVHEALRQDWQIDYINPPPSFENTGQKIRLVAETLSQHRGTCLDLAILQASLWEHIGLNPCLVLVPGHALMGCWIDSPSRSDTAVVSLGGGNPSAQTLVRALGNGTLQLFNSVEVALNLSLADAQENARAIVSKALETGKETWVIDIATCRATVTPLP